MVTIRQAATASGLTPDTIRFYERKGILPGPARSENGYRRYADEHILILGLARGLRQLAVPLDQVAPILQVAHDGTCSEVRETLVSTLTTALAEADRRLSELVRLREHVVEILAGLDAMVTGSSTVPGIEPCQCVRMVSDA